MKLTLIILALFALQQSDCGEPVEQQSGYTVRLCSERDMSSLIAYSNQWLSQTDIRFVQSTDVCDATILFEAPKVRDAAGSAVALTGTIKLAPHADINVSFMHEILHIAGVPHEPDDRENVMFTHVSSPFAVRQLRAHHVEALRRLAGVTPLGRLGRQIESMQ